MSISSLDDVLQAISAAVNNEEEFPLTVSRSNVVERGLAQWKRQKKALPSSQLRIRFIGEVGVDTGALRKEFLTEMVAGIEQKLFVGDQTGKCPKYSMLHLDQANFRSAGEIWAASLAQSGPPPCCLKLWCYKYLCDGEIQIQHISKEDVSDAEYTSLLSQVESATEATMTELTEDILSCGYNGPVKVQKREERVRLMLTVFAACHPEFSEKGSNKEQVEVNIQRWATQQIIQVTCSRVRFFSGSQDRATFLMKLWFIPAIFMYSVTFNE
ncbi:hypothetical protein DPEC_G00018050 [Dallia pectoralis]|uniref:Uncharacterized protein n=1 Tax=Dallia pectoralis TaxID=75939 RepID=A0ACC2HF87_DALPE|nr:hypothetical protein DPEC_G00018050 [Dallia pectoralis]